MQPSLLMTGSLGEWEYVQSGSFSGAAEGDFLMATGFRQRTNRTPSDPNLPIPPWSGFQRYSQYNRRTGDGETVYNLKSRVVGWAHDGGSVPANGDTYDRLLFRLSSGKQATMTPLSNGVASLAGLKGPIGIAYLGIRNNVSAWPTGTVNGVGADYSASRDTSTRYVRHLIRASFWLGPFDGSVTLASSGASQFQWYAVHTL